MKNKGIVKIDDVGRIVIPKTIRNVLQLKDKLVELYVDGDKLIIKKYAPLGLCNKLIKNLCDKVAFLTGQICIVGDKNKIINVSSKALNFIEGKQISYELKNLFNKQSTLVYSSKNGQNIPLFENSDFSYGALCLSPLNDENCCVGFFALISLEESDFGEKEVYSLKVAKELFLSALMHEKEG